MTQPSPTPGDLRDRLRADMRTALKARESEVVSVLRTAIAAILGRIVEARRLRVRAEVLHHYS